MTRELKKVSEDKYVLETYDENADLHTKKGYAKKELKDIYRSLEAQKNQALMQRDKLLKQMEGLGEGLDDPEIIDLADKLEKAQKRLQKKKMEEQLEGVNADIENNEAQQKEIKLAVPEVDRAPKK